MLLVVLGILAAAAFSRDHVVIGVALIGAAIGVVGVAWGAPRRRLRRMLRRARVTVPVVSGRVTMLGTVVSANEPLAAPHSKRGCVAYWERSLVETEGTWSTVNESSASVDFVLRCGDATLAVEGTGAAVIVEASAATRTTSEDRHAATEEVVAQPGDRLVVSGRLVYGAGGGPFRAGARIERAGSAGVVLGLLGGR